MDYGVRGMACIHHLCCSTMLSRSHSISCVQVVIRPLEHSRTLHSIKFAKCSYLCSFHCSPPRDLKWTRNYCRMKWTRNRDLLDLSRPGFRSGKPSIQDAAEDTTTWPRLSYRQLPIFKCHTYIRVLPGGPAQKFGRCGSLAQR